MKVSYISRDNVYSSKRNYYASSPVSNSSKVSFGGKRVNDRYIAEEFYKDFVKMIDSEADYEKNKTVLSYGLDSKSFFTELNRQNETVISNFLLSRNGTDESPFSMALINDRFDLAKTILEIAEDSDNSTKFKFLVPDKNRMNGPLIQSVNNDKNHVTTRKILQIVKTMKPEQQAEFYYMTPKNTFGINTDMVKERQDTGYNQVAQEFEADRVQFEIENPIIAEKYKKVLQNSNRNNSQKLADSEPKETQKFIILKYIL